MALGVIPARANSTRFPLKALAPIAGKPMVQHVWELASRAKRLAEIIVATDDARILDVATGFGARACLTSTTLPSGTDRVAVVAKDHAFPIIVNLQGDEPLLDPSAIDRLVEALTDDPNADMATLAVERNNPEELQNRNVVKVVVNQQGDALYFSREALASSKDGRFLKHIGIYAYRAEALRRLCELAPSALELTESLEQLRALENGFQIKVVRIQSDTQAVDVPDDIQRVENELSRRGQNSRTPSEKRTQHE